MKVKEALMAHQAHQQLGRKAFSVDVSMKFAANQRTLNECQETANEKRLTLVKKFGEKNDAGASEVKPENMEKFTNAYDKILDEEVELDLKSVSLSDMPPKFEVEPNILVALPWLFAPRNKNVSGKKKS